MKKKKKRIYNILLIIAIAVFIFSAYKVGTILYHYHLQDSEKAEMMELADIPKNPEKEPFSIDWKKLKAVNEEIVAWILIPDTDISYPVVHGSDNDYYLTHTAEKKELYSGAIFIDANASEGFVDKNTIIYGHNVLYGTMFAQIEDFKDKTFFDEHPYVYIFTPDKNYRAEIFSMYTDHDTSPSYTTRYGDETAYINYIDMVKAKSDHKRDIALNSDDHIVTLSTCSYEKDGKISDLRYLLHAKLVAFDGTYLKEK